MFRTMIILSFLSLIFAAEGEIVNVTAAQRTDGSGIVDISYELLPDDTFPSFEVSVYSLTEHPSLSWIENETGGIDVFAHTIYDEWFWLGGEFYNCGGYNENGQPIGTMEFTFSDSSFFSSWEDEAADNYFNMYTYTSPIPAGTEDLFLLSIHNIYDGELSFDENCMVYISAWDHPPPEGWMEDEGNVECGWHYGFDSHVNPIEVVGEGVGGNIFPGIYNLTWQAPSDFYSPDVQIRIVAYAHIIDTPLPFAMITIPPGSYYDVNGNIQNMDYSYEIMKFELTNQELAYWALTQGLDACGDDILSIIGGSFESINYDGSVLDVEPGYANLPALTGTEQAVDLECFLDYYGLRVPTADEWLYAARGSADIPFPWYDDDHSCYDQTYFNIDVCDQYDNWGMEYCMTECYLENLCVDNNFPFKICDFDDEYESELAGCLYEVGLYPNNVSYFGVYDMLGNAPEVVISGSLGAIITNLSYVFLDLTEQFGNPLDCDWNVDEIQELEGQISFEIFQNPAVYNFLYNEDNFYGGLRLVRTVNSE